MWQEIAVYLILAVGAGFTLWSFYGKFTGEKSCCGGGCTCKGGQGKRSGKANGRSGTQRCAA
jgi:hypothetical protein